MPENEERISKKEVLKIDFNPKVEKPKLPTGFVKQDTDCLVFKDSTKDLPEKFTVMEDAKTAVTHPLVVEAFADIEAWLEKNCTTGRDQAGPKEISVIFSSREERTKFRNAIPHINSKMWFEVKDIVYIIEGQTYFLYHVRLGNTKIACEIAENN